MPKINEDDYEEVEDIDDDEIVGCKYSVTSYGADYPVDGLVKRIENGSILVPDFQRKYVWTKKQASRFIESLLLGLPVPGVFFEKVDDQTLLIIDGQQRLLSLDYFYTGVFDATKREFSLNGVQEQYEGQTYKTLDDTDRRRLDDAIIHATVVRQDEPTNDRGSIYHVFERLNTGGTQLTAQEIRTCVYRGEFCNLLKKLNANSDWREIFGSENKRMKDQELILRFIALLHNSEDYSRPMKGFLNDFMGTHQDLDLTISSEVISKDFFEAIALVNASIGKKAFRPTKTLNAAVFDSVMVGIARRLKKGSVENTEGIRSSYDSLLLDQDFQNAFKKATADEASVRQRLELATNAFADIE